LQGTVTDPNGGVVSGADVLIKNAETGQERTVKTNSDGVYVAPFVPIGRYSVTVSQQGFKTTLKEGVEVGLNQTRVVDIRLDAGSITETVTVESGGVAPINTTNAEIKGTLNSQEILDKPVFNQGNFLTLAETFTGFQENPTSGQNNPTASSGSRLTSMERARAARLSRSTE
jgi:hypothetical protein